MCAQDGVDYLIRAVGTLRDELGRDDVHCVLVGGGPHQQAMREYAEEQGVAELCTFTGRVSDDDLCRILSSADVAVDPDPKTPWSDKSTMNKIMEYMFFGLPIVSFDLTETRASARDAAVYAPANDHREMARSIACLLDDPEQRDIDGVLRAASACARHWRGSIRSRLSWRRTTVCSVRDPSPVRRAHSVDRQNVIVVHNHYQRPGGEDQVVGAEVALLQSFGHETQLFSLDNSAIAQMGSLRLTRATFWNNDVYDTLRALFRKHAPLVAHFHNTFPLVSPAAYYAARDEGVPVVQTLHNFRLICPNGLLFRDGHACEECVGRSVAWPGVVHGCYRGSRSTTAVTAAMIAWHRARGTWATAVDMYIALSQFSRGRFTEGGLPKDRIAVKPNFLARDPGVGDHAGGYGLFVGRLSPEKGLGVLLDAWSRLATPYPLKVVGKWSARERGSMSAVPESSGWAATDGARDGADEGRELSPRSIRVLREFPRDDRGGIRNRTARHREPDRLAR